MNSRSNLDELLQVLEQIRQEKYPDIPADVLREIVFAQFECSDSRIEARTKTQRIVAEFINRHISDKGE